MMQYLRKLFMLGGLLLAFCGFNTQCEAGLIPDVMYFLFSPPGAPYFAPQMGPYTPYGYGHTAGYGFYPPQPFGFGCRPNPCCTPRPYFPRPYPAPCCSPRTFSNKVPTPVEQSDAPSTYESDLQNPPRPDQKDQEAPAWRGTESDVENSTMPGQNETFKKPVLGPETPIEKKVAPPAIDDELENLPNFDKKEDMMTWKEKVSFQRLAFSSTTYSKNLQVSRTKSHPQNQSMKNPPRDLVVIRQD